MWNRIKQTSVYRTTLLMTLLSVAISCTAPPPTNMPTAPVPVTKLQDMRNLLTDPTPQPLKPEGFRIKGIGTSGFPPPPCVNPGATLETIDMGYKRSVGNKYGFFGPSDDYNLFARGFMALSLQKGTVHVDDVHFETNDGPNWYVLGAGLETSATSFAEDFTVAVPSEKIVFVYSNEYASDYYIGGTMMLQYSASSRTMKVTAGGSGVLQPNFYSWSGNSYFNGSADFALGFPVEPFNLEVVYDRVYLPPNAPKSAEYNVAAEYCNKNWILNIEAQSDTADANGSKACSWTQTGNGDKTGIQWDGTCDGSGSRKAKPGTYPVRLKVDGDPQYTVGTTVEVIGAASPTPTPTATPTPTPTPPGPTATPTPPIVCPGDPSCPIVCPFCPAPTPTPPNPTATPPNATPTPTPPNATPTPTPPNPTPTPPGSTPTPTPPVPTPSPSGCSQDIEEQTDQVLTVLDELSDALANDDRQRISTVFLRARLDKLKALLSSYCVAGPVDPAYNASRISLYQDLEKAANRLASAKQALVDAQASLNPRLIAQASLAFFDAVQNFNKVSRNLTFFIGASGGSGEPVGPPVGSGRVRAAARCNVVQIRSTATCPARVRGVGYGSDGRIAFSNAQTSANLVVPPGCYKRHCHQAYDF